ncbi:imidazolonepropionase [Caldisphaera sp.]|uniref:imidazolonepropionase n=1 Tax=Caldisphaera sp. TaxID=2060322 RepID=UPI0025BD65E9|nr:imidazolonepropionase [Caldisphaera sp.]
MNNVDLVIYNIGEAVYFKEPIRKVNDENTKMFKDFGIAINNGKIFDIGSSDYILTKYNSKNKINADKRLLTSGFVDMHTHAIFAGSREDELYKKLSGISYSQILKEGGGIYKTVSITKNASEETLKSNLEKILKKSISLGTVAIEIKSGYGLDLENELKLLRVINSFKEYNIISTLLAHVIPKEFDGDEYVDYFINKIIPEVKRQNLAKYVDVFCDENAFNLEQTRRIFKAALKYGFKLRMHADQIKYIGCSDLVKEFPLSSIDHLESTPQEKVKALSETGSALGLLPASVISMLDNKKPAIDSMRNKAIIALGTDYSPNNPMISMQTVFDLAIYYLNFKPIEALAYSTINSAYSLGLNHLGNIDIGKEADLIIWDVENLNQLGYYWGYDRINTLIYKGKIIKSQEN